MGIFTKAVLIVGGAMNVVLGLWAFFAPMSFFEQVATFPPYNEHLLHDLGAFQVGLGVTLLLALRWADAAFVALAGVGTASVFHVASHVIDADLGGRPSDFVVLGSVAALLVVAAVHRGVQLSRQGGAGWHVSKDDHAKV